MFSVTLPPVNEAHARMERDGFAVLRRLVEPSAVSILRLSSSTLPERRVTCGIPNVAWGEQLVPATHLLARFFQQADLARFIAEATNIASFSSVGQYWTSRYRLHEYINEHRDVRGSVQLLVCLTAPAPDCGGTLRFGPGGKDGQVRLEEGDGVLFYATRKLHSTTPLVTSASDPEPERLVAVARLFGDGEGACPSA